MGDGALDRRHRADRGGPVPYRACPVLAGFLVNGDRSARSAKVVAARGTCAGVWRARSTARRQVFAAAEELPYACRGRGAGHRGDRPADAEQDRYAILATQPLLACRLAGGIDLHDPRSVRDGHDHADHGAHLLRGASGEALDDTLDVPWMDFTRGLHAPS